MEAGVERKAALLAFATNQRELDRNVYRLTYKDVTKALVLECLIAPAMARHFDDALPTNWTDLTDEEQRTEIDRLRAVEAEVRAELERTFPPSTEPSRPAPHPGAVSRRLERERERWFQRAAHSAKLRSELGEDFVAGTVDREARLRRMVWEFKRQDRLPASWSLFR